MVFVQALSYPAALQIGDPEKYPKCQGKDVWSSYWITEFQATQIGLAPFFIQPDDDSLPGMPLCTIASVQPATEEPYPWVNVPEPLSPEEILRRSGGELMIGDLGCIYISIDDDGRLYSCESCY